MPVNPKKYIDKLMRGLETHGKYYNYSMKRFYSTNVDRYVMKYILEDVDNKARRIEVYNKLEILKFLVREYSEVTGQPVPEACLEALDDKKEKEMPKITLDSFKHDYKKNRKRGSRGTTYNK